MNNTEILLIINSILLGIISLLFVVLGYFFRDLHRDFKRLIERVNKLSSDMMHNSNLFEKLGGSLQRQIDKLRERITNIEKKQK